MVGDTGSVRGGVSTLPLAEARRAVGRHARPTPLLASPRLSAMVGRQVWLKVECLQRTGSFKVRGAAARLEALDAEERRRGVVTCSSGNHGRAVSYVAGRLGVPATVYVPEWVDPVKLEGIRAGGAVVVTAGATFDASEAEARRHALESGGVYVSAYDDPRVIAGQASLGFEIFEELAAPPAAVLVPLSGGGLAAGIAAALEVESASPTAETGATATRATTSRTPTRAESRMGATAMTVGVSAIHAAAMLASLRAGRPVEVPERDTLASALAGGIGLDNRWSFDLVRSLVHDHVEVSEEEIAEGVRFAVEHHRVVSEGGGAVGIAALLGGWMPPGDATGDVVVVVSGGNIDPVTLARILRR